MVDKVEKSPWESIHDFRSRSEFERFESWMQDEIRNLRAREVAVGSSYAGTTLSEKWFVHMGSGEVWRLVWPDPPFRGVFERV